MYRYVRAAVTITHTHTGAASYISILKELTSAVGRGQSGVALCISCIVGGEWQGEARVNKEDRYSSYLIAVALYH